MKRVPSFFIVRKGRVEEENSKNTMCVRYASALMSESKNTMCVLYATVLCGESILL